MKKVNNKGFMLTETIVVSTFTLTILVLLFVYFKDLVIAYNDSYRYNTVEGVYSAGVWKRLIVENGKLSSISNKAGSGCLTLVTKNTGSGSYVADEYIIDSTLNLSYVGYDLAETLASKTEVKTVIYTHVSNLNTIISSLPESMREFVRKLDKVDGKHRLIIEYTNGDFATITFGSV